MNTMIMDLLTDTYDCNQKDKNTGSAAMDVSFLDMARRKLGEDSQRTDTVAAAEAVMGTAVSTNQMTLEEYKDYVRDWITYLWLNPAQGDVHYAIHITDAAFARMQRDKEYEKYVFDSIQTNMKFSPPFLRHGTTYVILYFGGKKKDDWGYTYNSQLGKEEYDRKSKESTWKKSAEEKARAKKRLKKILEKKYIEKKYLESKRVEEFLMNRRLKSISKTQELNAQSTQTGAKYEYDE